MLASILGLQLSLFSNHKYIFFTNVLTMNVNISPVIIFLSLLQRGGYLFKLFKYSFMNVNHTYSSM